ncbi:MAG TPA: DCC1-like thiol-disulfide oxidoreductase family protein [Candidatus Sulfotelmatobacter sp.]|nr:DCC1-like thiol-disulfide oxidoreductase family protein [Candidatus Sulfotelmatobacter sp.]
MSHPILLYDGVCGLCNRLVQFVLRRDSAGVFRFAALQSPLAGRILARHGLDARDLDTLCVVVNTEQPDEILLPRSDAVIFILRRLGSSGELAPAFSTAAKTAGLAFSRLTGFLLQFVPRTLRDWGYGVVARRRYRMFGRYDACPLPTEDTRSRFLDR